MAAQNRLWGAERIRGELLKHLALCRGRGVWESNPPGAAPSEPPAVLKTLRPTGAPTLPYVGVYFAIQEGTCQAWLGVLL